MKVIAIDWSHTKDLTTYDGKKVRIETLKTLIARLSKGSKGEESILSLESTSVIHSPLVILDQVISGEKPPEYLHERFEKLKQVK